MKINVSGISRNINASMEVNGEVAIPMINYNGDDIAVKSPIKVNALVTNTGEHLLIAGKIKADLILRCSKCIEKFDFVLETVFEEELSNSDRNKDEDIIHFEGDILDLTDIVVNNVLLNLPMKFVCSENCRGLCPNCGCNLNINECNCTDKGYDPRLSVLKDLLKGN